jgi:hypothetical protein
LRDPRAEYSAYCCDIDGESILLAETIVAGKFDSAKKTIHVEKIAPVGQ